MKRFLLAVFLLLGASLAASRAGAQVDSCLSLWRWNGPPNTTYENPDSLMVDTCISDTCQYDPLSEPCSWYAKRKFFVHFQYYIFPDSLGPSSDSVVRQWREIDTTFPLIRKQMQIMEQRFGHFDLHYAIGGGFVVDTSSRFAKRWGFYFDRYVSVNSTIRYLLDSLPGLDTEGTGLSVDFSSGLHYNAGGGSKVNSLPEGVQCMVAWPQPCTNEIILQGVGTIKTPEFMDLLGHRLMLPTRFETNSTLHVDLTTVQGGILFLKFPEQIVRVTVRK